MNNEQANSPIGLAARGLAFALVETVERDYHDKFIAVDKLQKALFEYGDAIVSKTTEFEYSGIHP